MGVAKRGTRYSKGETAVVCMVVAALLIVGFSAGLA
jgi:hypothetical protein